VHQIIKNHYIIDEFVEKTVKQAIINYIKKQTWISYDGENFHIHDEKIKEKIHKNVFSSARETLDVIKFYLKENNCYSKENLIDDSDDVEVDF